MLMDESRSLQNRVHLVSQAQQAARSMEQDYEEVRIKCFHFGVLTNAKKSIWVI